MARARPRFARFKPSLPFVLLAGLLVILWLTGGASREDAAGQIISRAASWIVIITVIIVGRRPRIEDARVPAMVLLAAILLCIVQFVPLPPGIWRSLAGRDAFTDPLISPPDLWRPWSLVPGATINAAFSLVVPCAIILLMTALDEDQRRWVPATLLAVIAGSLIVGLLQFTGISIVNPFVNAGAGEVGGLLANRNHYALFLSFGLLIVPCWAFSEADRSKARGPIAFGLMILLVLTILASGSRAGVVLGLLGLGMGLTIARRGVRSAFKRYPRWVVPSLGASLIFLIVMFVLASISADRAVSIGRVANDDVANDLRSRALPTVLAITRQYFPFGTGMGSFDPIFRMHEPDTLLGPTYFNHAHNDFLEVVLNAGLVGVVLLVGAIGWWSLEKRRGLARKRGATKTRIGNASANPDRQRR